MEHGVAETLISDLWTAFPPLFRLIRSGWKKGAEQGLSVYHYETLGILLTNESLSMSEIRDRLGVQKSNLTPIVDGLVRKGLVRRDADSDDRRVIRVSLTARGQRFMTRGKERAKGEMDAILGSFTEGEAKALALSLRRLGDVLSR